MNVQCPCCGDRHSERLGWLPDSHWFAGKRLAQPLPGGALYRCPQCLLKFRHPLPAPGVHRVLYDNAETGTWPGDAPRPDWDLILREIAALRPKGGRVLDFGCYSGGLLSRLDRRYLRFGIEINREAARLASETTGARVWHAIGEIPDDERFDVIVIADVVEHVPDPRALLDTLSRHLADGGAIVISTGNADARLWNLFGANWWYCFYPEHIAFISRGWIEHALCPRGWTLITCETFRYRRLRPGQWLIELSFAWLYGLFPRIYLDIAKALKHQPAGIASVPGNGISADHLLIAISRTRSS